MFQICQATRISRVRFKAIPVRHLFIRNEILETKHLRSHEGLFDIYYGIVFEIDFRIDFGFVWIFIS
jgi:hypothetical protein